MFRIPRFHAVACSAALLIGGLLPATSASAATNYWEYRDWTVWVERRDTGEDLRITCRASTGGDGDPVLSVEVSNGDVLPPFSWPPVTIMEYAPRGYTTMLRNGDSVDATTDQGWFGSGKVYAGHDADGIPYAVANLIDLRTGDSLSTLREMRHGAWLEVLRQGQLVYSASLSGFTAAWGKMAEQCGFSTEGVID